MSNKPRVGRTPEILRKGGAQRDRTKDHRPSARDSLCDDCGEPVRRCACIELEAAFDRTKYYRPATRHDDGDSLTGVLMECNYCSEIALPYEGGECRECGTPQYF